MITRLLLILTALLLSIVLGATAFVWGGVYDISANVQHTQAVYTLLEQAMHQSVKVRAARIEVPVLDDARLVSRGAVCYQEKCLQCHGGPGIAQAEIGRSMQPLPGPLVDARMRWKPSELYWITRNGIKMSGMPAWQHRMPDNDLWAVVAFMQKLPDMTTLEFRALNQEKTASQCLADPNVARSSPSGVSVAPPVSPEERGRKALTQYACNACHRIPGVTGSDVSVGPSLAEFANRQLVAGAVSNSSEQLIRWIKNPQSIDPLTTMPNMGVTDQDARDIAIYLHTLR